MGNPFLKTRQAETRKPLIQRLYGGRFRVTRFLDDMQGLRVAELLALPYGTADEGDVTAMPEFHDLCLIGTGITDSDRKDADTRTVQMVYETLTNALVDVEKPKVDYEMNGLKRVTHKLIGLATVDLADYDFEVGVSEYAESGLFLARYSEAESDDAATRIALEYLEPGIVSRGERMVDRGLKEVTLRVFHTPFAELEPAEPGVLVGEEKDNYEGYPVWRYTVLQSPNGGDPTDGTAETVQDYVPFTYPGRASAYTLDRSFTGVAARFVDVYMSPPIEALVLATITTTYQTSAEMGALPHSLWNPTDWAVVRGSWGSADDRPRSKVEGLRGYRAASPSATATGSGSLIVACLGEYCLPGVQALVNVSGGPPAPTGAWVIGKPELVPAFVSRAGVQYYRRTIAVATPPAQAALPV